MNWLIWSFEHNGWWKLGGQGYSSLRSQAERYSLEEAVEIVKNSNYWITGREGSPEYDQSPPEEAMIPEEEGEWNK